MVGTPDQFHFHPLHDCDETTNKGALCAMVRAHVNMNIIEEVSDDNHKFVGQERFVLLYGDQLTEPRFYPVMAQIKKSLTKIGKEEYVNQLVSVVNRSLVQHDYLHETFHIMQAIYVEYWGGFLQPLVCLMNMKHISGDPMGGGKIIDHHNFLMVVYRSLCCHRSITFVAKLIMNGIG